MRTNAKLYGRFLETMSPKTLTELPNYLDPDVHFKDPFNDVIGITEVMNVFHHMFKNIKNIRFQINSLASSKEISLLQWTFSGELKNRQFSIDGTSKVVFNNHGLVIEHIDYWDSGQNVYEKIPFFRLFITWLRHRLSAS
tara:strand:+ start:306 stop:725 length:420 start_codon:yes stop_codon:yes gene_type:complete